VFLVPVRGASQFALSYRYEREYLVPYKREVDILSRTGTREQIPRTCQREIGLFLVQVRGNSVEATEGNTDELREQVLNDFGQQLVKMRFSGKCRKSGIDYTEEEAAALRQHFEETKAKSEVQGV
jgi:hypothetical protein